MLVSLSQIKSVEHLKPIGYMEDILKNGILKTENNIGEVIDIPDHIYWNLVKKYSPETFSSRIILYTCGVGCQLGKILHWFGIRDNGACGCSSFSNKMDSWGPDGCLSRIDQIIEHLRNAAKEQGLPFSATIVKLIVYRAIDLTRKEIENKLSSKSEN